MTEYVPLVSLKISFLRHIAAIIVGVVQNGNTGTSGNFDLVVYHLFNLLPKRLKGMKYEIGKIKEGHSDNCINLNWDMPGLILVDALYPGQVMHLVIC